MSSKREEHLQSSLINARSMCVSLSDLAGARRPFCIGEGGDYTLPQVANLDIYQQPRNTSSSGGLLGSSPAEVRVGISTSLKP